MRIDKQEFVMNLRLTQAYCEQRLQDGLKQTVSLLRSLNPDFGEEKLFCYKENSFSANAGRVPLLVVEWHPEADPYDNSFVAAIFEKQLSAKQSALGLDYEINPEGKILVVEYELDIPDGASAVASEGFVDCVDFPPIDTWFYRVQNGSGNWILFAWVPKQFIKQAQEAIDVHFLGIIHWFKEWAPAEHRWLVD